MIRFSKEKVLLLHKMIAQETGGSIGVRDEGLLEHLMGRNCIRAKKKKARGSVLR